MSESRNPFDSIESAQDFLVLLSEAIEDAVIHVKDDQKAGQDAQQLRRVEALNLALYKLKLLHEHIDKSRRLLKDLGSIRRILVGDHPELDEADLPEQADSPDEAPPEAAARFGV